MKFSSKSGGLAAVLALAFSSAAVAIPANLIHEYTLDGNAQDSLGGSDLSLGQGTFFEPNGGISFGANEGPSALGTPVVSLFNTLPTRDYSLELRFTLDPTSYFETTTVQPGVPALGLPDITFTTLPFVKIFDFDDRQTDPGLYLNADGKLEFRTLGAIGDAVLQASQNYHLVFTRDGQGEIQAYLDSIPQFGSGTPAMDTLDQAVFDSDSLHVFLNDNESNDKMAGALVSDLRIYEGALTQPQVAMLASGGTPPGFNSVPVPSGVWLMAPALLLLRQRRRKVTPSPADY